MTELQKQKITMLMEQVGNAETRKVLTSFNLDSMNLTEGQARLLIVNLEEIHA